MKTLRVQSVDQWRDWLDEHHASESEIWLLFYKRHTGVASIDYKDALDEALCFGWVDSLVSAWMTGGTHSSLRRGERTADGQMQTGNVTRNSKPADD